LRSRVLAALQRAIAHDKGMGAPFAIGSVVVIHDPALAAQLGRGGECGVVLKRRRGDVRVLFLSDRKAHWIADRRLWHSQTAPRGLERIATALRLLASEEAQIEPADGGSIELHAQCLQFEAAQLERLQAELGGALRHWRVAPYGMAQLTVVLTLAD
jgi:hypothetical protein